MFRDYIRTRDFWIELAFALAMVGLFVAWMWVAA